MLKCLYKNIELMYFWYIFLLVNEKLMRNPVLRFLVFFVKHTQNSKITQLRIWNNNLVVGMLKIQKIKLKLQNILEHRNSQKNILLSSMIIIK